MAKDKDPPRYLMPGDDPKIDAALTRLRKDGEDGDPLYIDFRKRRRQRAPLAEPEGGQPAAPEPAEDASGGIEPPVSEGTAQRPVEPQPVELPASPTPIAPLPANAKGPPSHAPSRRLLWAALAITASVIAVAIGFLWSHSREAGGPAAATAAPSVQVKDTSTVPTAETVTREPLPAPSAAATVPSATTSAPAPRPHGKRAPAPDDPYADAAAPTAPTVAPSAPPVSPPVRVQTEDSREF